MTAKKSLLILLFLFSGVPVCQAANELKPPLNLLKKLTTARDTSRLKILNELGHYYTFICFSRALWYANKAKELAEELNYSSGKVAALINKGNIYLNYYDYTNALNYYNKAYLLARHRHLKQESTASLQAIANTYRQKGELEKAVDFYIKSLKLMEPANNHARAACFNNIADLYANLKNPEKAFEFHYKALKIQKFLNDFKAVASTYYQLGKVHFYKKNYDDAEACYKHTIINAEKFSLNGLTAKAFIGIAEINQEKQRFADALKYLHEAEQLGRLSENKINLIETYNLFGTIFFHLNLKDSALVFLQKASGIALEAGTGNDVEETYNNLYYAYKRLNNPVRALYYHELARQVSDSLHNHQQTRQLMELQAKYQAEKKSKEIAILKKEKGEVMYKAKEHAKFRNYLLLTLILLTIIGTLLFKMYRSKQKANHWLEHLVKERTNQLEAKTQEKEIMLKEIHHRVKNNLQLISSLMNLQMHYKGDKDTEDILSVCQHRIKCMALIHDKLYKAEELAGLNVQEYFTELSNFITQGYVKGDTEVKMALNVPEITLPIDKMIPCGLILNEVVSNSLKYGFKDRSKGLIGISLERTNGTYHLLIEDNGVGLPENIDFLNLNSLGLTLVHDLVDQLDGKISIKNNSGTQVYITFPS